MTALLSFVLPFIVFISFPSHLWNFDGVACAAALELGNPVFLFHSNHLLYGFFGFLFWKTLSPWAIYRALPALQLFTSMLSAAGLAGLYTLLQKKLLDQRLALGLTIGVSVSAVVWVWSVEAQVYALGFLAIAWATYELFQPEHRGKWIAVGALQAAAVLGHIVHVLWIIPGGYWLWKQNPPAKHKKAAQYLLTLAGLVLIPYALVIGVLIVPHEVNNLWLKKWLMGSAALNPTSVFQWHSAGWTGPLQWAVTSLHIFWGSFWPYHTDVPVWCWVLTIVSVLDVGFLLGASVAQKKDPRWVFSVLWLAVYGIFFWTWEPTTECYRMTDLVPLAILLALGLGRLRPSALRWGALTVLLLTLVPINLRTRIVPMSDPALNPVYQDILSLASHTPDDSIYLTIGGPTWIYLLYFSGRSAWDLHSFMRDPQHLEKEIARHYKTRPVFVQARALDTDLVKPWLAHYQTKPVDPAHAWLQLQ